MTEEILENIRLRINIASNSVAGFSTDSNLENEDLSSFWTVETNGEILPELIVRPNKFDMFMEVLEVNFISEDYLLQITKKDSIKNERFETKLNKVFMDIEKTGNILYGVTYNATTKRFQYQFPSNNRMTKMKVVHPGDLAERLGFELNREITPKKVSLVVDPKETEDRARALSHETGLVIVLDYNTGTNTTVGIAKRYMAALYPTETGNMVMHNNEISNQQPVMTLPSVNMTNKYIPVTFLLSTFSGHNKLVNLVSKEGFTMQGTLTGVHPLKMK